MKRFIIVTACIVLICGALFYFTSWPGKYSDAAATGGVVNLNGHDLSSELVKLDGEWEFYFNELLTPEAARPDAAPYGDSGFIKVPMSWDKAGYPLKGSATYRLTVLTDELGLMLHIPKITFSSVVWVNGKKVFSAGIPGRTREEATPGVGTAFVPVTPENGRIEIVVQAASYNWYVAGLRNGWELGRSDIMLKDAAVRYSLLALAIGALLVMALYHIILFAYRRSERVYLAFALTLLSSCLRYFLETHGFAQLLLPGGMGEGLMRLYLSTVILQPGLEVFFTHSVFSVPYKSAARRVIYTLCAVVPMFFTFVLPDGIIYANYYLFLVTVPMVWSVISALRASRSRISSYNALFLVSMAIFILWYPIQKIWLDDALFMPGAATHMFLSLSQCVMLAVSYAETKRRIDDLAAKTDFFRKMNHSMRTPLTVLSTNIQVARLRPEEAEGLLKDSQAEIMKLADMVSDALKNNGGAGER
ncbi:MAG: hypothetical protein LBS19_16385 [Clostridiales bacterium]|jgi:signal transduction histidine kinase|nr:hypothetical protein [Clostridiales bacterium]